MDNNSNNLGEENNWGNEPENKGEYVDESIGDQFENSNDNPYTNQTYNQNGQFNNFYPNMPPREFGQGMGIASLILGVVSLIGLCCCISPVTGILAIVFGIIQINRTPQNKTYSIIGIVTGGLGILLGLIILAVMFFGVDYGAGADFDQLIEQLEDVYEL